MIELDVYDLVWEVNILGVKEDEVTLVFTMSADMKADQIKNLQPMFEILNRISPGKIDRWKVKFEYLGER